MTKTGTASRTTAETGSADLKSNVMDGGIYLDSLVMVNFALMTATVKILDAEEVSALT